MDLAERKTDVIMRTMNNYVIVDIDQSEEITTGRHNIIVPRRTTMFKVTGKVRSIGPTCRIPELRPGMTVLFPPYGAGNRTNLEGVEIIALLDWEILGWFDD